MFYEDKWDVGGMSLSEKMKKYYAIFVNEDGKIESLLFDHAIATSPLTFSRYKDGDVQKLLYAEKNMILSVGNWHSQMIFYTFFV